MKWGMDPMEWIGCFETAKALGKECRLVMRLKECRAKVV
jgi:hypothetical protein